MQIPMIQEHFTPVHVLAAYPDKKTIQVQKTEKTLPDENTFLRLDGVSFHNGTIDVDVCGRLLPDAPDYARGFIGIVFRADASGSEFESFYIRPTNGRGCTDPVRQMHGCQYFSYPGYTFAYFREFGIDIYEARADMIALNEWCHIHAEIQDDAGTFYVNGEKLLHVCPLKHGALARGSVGLYVDIGTDGLFRNLQIECTD